MADRKTARREAPRARAATPPRFTLSTAWAGAILALLVIVFFHQVSVGGKTFVSPDATAPAGFVRMGEKALYQEHTYPLWNPYVFLGMPSFGSGAYNPLIYPPDWPLALVQKVVPLPDMTWMLLYYALGAWFLFLLAREWGARSEGALLGAAAFVFAPNLVAVGSHGHGSQLVDSAYVPLMLWLATRWLRRGGLHHLGALALAGGFQLLRGHVQICFYTWMALGVYVVVDTLAVVRAPAQLASRVPRALGVALAATLAFGMAGFYSLPLQDYARYSIRGGSEGGGVGLDYATQWSLAPYELPSMVVPGWVGFGGSSYWGGMPFTDYPNIYVGMVTLVLALPAFLAGGAARVFALALAGIAIVISFGHNFPLYGWLYAHLPLFNKFRVPVMVVLLFQVAAALGAAWGWSAVLDAKPAAAGKRSPLDRLLLIVAAVLGAALLVGVLGQDAWRGAYVNFAVARHQPFTPELAQFAFAAFVPDLLRACVVGALVVGVAWLTTRGRMPAGAATVAVLVVLLFELWPVSARVMNPVIGDVTPGGLEQGRDDVVEFLEQAGPQGSFRVLPLEEFQSNRYAGFGIASVGGYHAAKPQLFKEFFDKQLMTNGNWMRLLNVRFLISAQAVEPLPPSMRLVHQGAAGYVYENLAALPRATVVGAWRLVRPGKAILDSIAAGTFDPATVTLLEADPGVTLGDVRGATAVITSYRLNDVTVDVDSPGPGLLRLADLWYPDWNATVDGRSAPVLKADDLLRAVPVPAGRHRVEFRFRSKAVRDGLRLSIGSLLVILVLIAFGVFRARAAAPAPAVSES